MSGTSPAVGLRDELRAPACTSAALCTKLSATMSTPSERPNVEIVHVLQRDRRRRQLDARRVDPLVPAEQAALDDGRDDFVRRRCDSTRSSIVPSDSSR